MSNTDSFKRHLKTFCTSKLTLTSFLYLVQLTFMGHSLGFILVFIFLLVSLLTAGHFYVSGFIDWLIDWLIDSASTNMAVFSKALLSFFSLSPFVRTSLNLFYLWLFTRFSIFAKEYNYAIRMSICIFHRRSESVLFSVVFVCDFVCLSICEHDNSWTVRDIIRKFSEHHPWSKGSIAV